MGERLNLFDEDEAAPAYTPEGREASPRQKVPNMGEIYPSEHMPANPLKDAATRQMSHNGGLASPRTELY
jgi:hypothetical protein